MKLHKGSILQATVEYIKELKKGTKELAKRETRLHEMTLKYKKLQIKALVRFVLINNNDI
jgi:hypothetical protein